VSRDYAAHTQKPKFYVEIQPLKPKNKKLQIMYFSEINFSRSSSF
jgi:hypothetical protein